MNQTQRKYLITQAIESVRNAVEEATSKSTEQLQKRKDFVRCPKALKEAIQDGSLRFAANPTSSYIDDLFLTTPYYKKRNAKADKEFGVSIALKQDIYIHNPRARNTWEHLGLHARTLHTEECIERVKALKTKMAEFTEEVMIGDSEDARRLLKELKDF